MRVDRQTPQASLASYYAQRAREYESIYEKPERGVDLQQLRHFVAETFAHQRVLEIACGTGYWTEIIAHSAASVVATDINEEVLAIARGKCIPSDKATFQQADAWALPAFEQKFTACLAAFWWSHLPKDRIAEFLRGLHGILSPGVKIMFIDNIYAEGSSTPISRTDNDGNTYQLRRLKNGSKHEVLKNFPTELELRAVVANFASDVKVMWLKYYWVLTYRLDNRKRIGY